MDHEKDRPGANLAQCDVTVFFLVMGKVTNGNSIRVVEDQFSRPEIDIMLGKILLALRPIALETHVAIPLFEVNNMYI